MSFEQAAMVKVNAVCAVFMLSKFGGLKSVDQVLVNAPLAVIGQMIIIFAAEKGFKTVSVVRREEAGQKYGHLVP